tara:strand:- start:715 stop:1119 length:405 start_codon:yes stop_codon:yes gene_type:complete
MGINSQEVAYGFGQMGSGHLKAVATDFFAPRGKVIVAITMLENILFDKLLADTTYQTGSATVDQGPSDTAYFGTGTQIAANGGDGAAGAFNQALSVVVAATVSFPKGLTIYGRWTNISLQGSNYTHGIIVYYGE